MKPGQPSDLTNPKRCQLLRYNEMLLLKDECHCDAEVGLADGSEGQGTTPRGFRRVR